MDIRTFRVEDVGAMRDIWNEVVLEGMAFPQIEPLPDDDAARTFFETQTRTAVAVEQIVDPVTGVATERVCGLYILHPNNIGRCSAVANASYAVASSDRGRGVGRALVQDSLAHLAPLGFTGLQFNAVVASNTAAIALYQQLGFTQVGLIPKGFRDKLGHDEDMYIFYHPALAVEQHQPADGERIAPEEPQTPPAPPVESAPALSANTSVSAPASVPVGAPADIPAGATATPYTASYAPPAFQQPTYSQNAPLLECRNLSKWYGGIVALDNVNLTLEPGRIVGLLGPNGSGKTTLMKLAAGLLQPSGGSITLLGMTPGSATKSFVSYLPERPYFSPSMKVFETLAFFADFYADFDMTLATTMLSDLAVPMGVPMSSLSKGTKEKVQLVLVMARRARLYLLDEPIGGVDPAARDYILKTIIGGYRREATLLISTHLVSDVESVLDDVVFLGNGHLFAEGSLEQFRAKNGMGLDEYFRRVFAC